MYLMILMSFDIITNLDFIMIFCKFTICILDVIYFPKKKFVVVFECVNYISNKQTS